MSPEHAIDLLAGMLRAMLYVAGPMLIATLVVGVVVGIIQTATQINEPSISFLVKIITLVGVGAALGSQLATHIIEYARTSLEAVAQVVR